MSIHHPPQHQPIRSRTGGVAMFVVSALLAGMAIYGAIYFYNTEIIKFAIYAVFGAVCAAVAAFRIGQKMLAVDAEIILANDPRKPVVYLRPFDADSKIICMQPLGVRHGGRKITHAIMSDSAERNIARSLTEIGPFVAVGAPGDKLSPLGAARMYLADDEWQAKVEVLVRDAAAIVLQPESSEGSLWEIGQVTRWVDPKRVLVMVPNPSHRPLGYARIQALTAKSFTVPLPLDCQNACAFWFDESGQPQPVVSSKKNKMPLEPFVEQIKKLQDKTGMQV